MRQDTFYIKEVAGNKSIQQLERILNNLNGIERVLVDTDDFEVKVQFDNKQVSKEQISQILRDYHFNF
ncbi:heavy-metal-associated domain-containing protein [Aquibacillus kalidii]|uniref:heavy-metal-associated domain-containing protein n=1 Tax=Aquibacillus kalidii TaxID=2762597 RepID=UPI00164415AB|nr:heavy-metal-associated domain-containing protein [Aquibacillus kalidii]